MDKNVFALTAMLAGGLLLGTIRAETLPDGYWSLPQATEILDKTRRVMLDPDLSHLSEANNDPEKAYEQAADVFKKMGLGSPEISIRRPPSSRVTWTW